MMPAPWLMTEAIAPDWLPKIWDSCANPLNAACVWAPEVAERFSAMTSKDFSSAALLYAWTSWLKPDRASTNVNGTDVRDSGMVPSRLPGPDGVSFSTSVPIGLWTTTAADVVDPR